MKAIKLTRSILPLLGLTLLTSASAVGAATIGIQIGGWGYLTYDNTDGDVRALTSNGQSATAAEFFTTNGYQAEINKLFDLSGANFTGTPENKQDKTSVFEVSTAYFAVKQGAAASGGGTAFFQVLSGAPVTFTVYSKYQNGEYSRPLQISHVTSFGSPVPLPAAVWLFGSALLGMVGIGYRRKTQSA